MRRSYLWALLIAVGVVGWMASGMFSSEVPQTANVDEANAEQADNDKPVKQLTVKAMTVENEKTALQVRASGVTRTSFDLEVMNRRQDFVRNIRGKEASWVKKGDVIIELSKGTLEADLAAARAERQAANAAYNDAKKRFSSDGTLAAQLNAAEAELAAIKATYDSTVKLVERGLATELALSNQRAQVKAAQTRLFELQSLSQEKEISASYASLKAVDARIASLQEQLSFTSITAPQDGWLEAVHVEVGEYIGANSAVARLLGLQEIILDAPIPQSNVNDVTVGDMAEVEIIGGGVHSGRVSKISTIANEATRTFTVEISLNNNEGNLRAGMSAEANVTINMVDAFQISPAHLNVDEDGQLTVKIVDENQKVAIAPVELVSTNGNTAFISGLADETIVLAAGQAFLSAGERVKYEIVAGEGAR